MATNKFVAWPNLSELRFHEDTASRLELDKLVDKLDSEEVKIAADFLANLILARATTRVNTD